MTTLTLYQVDAFTDRLFAGNPAAVIVLDNALTAPLMQAIAQENNLSETAFVVPRKDAGHFDLRWFTPTVEIDFCGHATIASAHVLRAERGVSLPVTFHAPAVGALDVDFKNERYCLNAPVFRATPTPITQEMRAAFPYPLEAAFHAGPNLYIVFERASDIRAALPDRSKVIPLSPHGVGITARGDAGYDCVSRFFVPAEGIDEDPVTGSAHAAIGPYWAERLGRKALKAYQASARGGEMDIELTGERVTLSGGAITYMTGQIKTA